MSYHEPTNFLPNHAWIATSANIETLRRLLVPAQRDHVEVGSHVWRAGVHSVTYNPEGHVGTIYSGHEQDFYRGVWVTVKDEDGNVETQLVLETGMCYMSDGTLTELNTNIEDIRQRFREIATGQTKRRVQHHLLTSENIHKLRRRIPAWSRGKVAVGDEIWYIQDELDRSFEVTLTRQNSGKEAGRGSYYGVLVGGVRLADGHWIENGRMAIAGTPFEADLEGTLFYCAGWLAARRRERDQRDALVKDSET